MMKRAGRAPGQALSAWGERGLLRWVSRAAGTSRPHWVVKGIGDDTAVLAVGGREALLVTNDGLAEGVHFDWRWTSWEALGWKALAVNLSDVAAMGGKPLAASVLLALPRSTSQTNLKEFYRGFLRLAHQHNVQLIGGDTIRAPSVVVDVTLLGRAKRHGVKYRSGARVGDVLCVTGPLGGAAAALAVLKQTEKQMGVSHTTPPRQRFKQLSKQVGTRWLRPLWYPTPQVKAGQLLAKAATVTAMMDNSDGLVASAAELMRQNKVGVRLFAEQLPVAAGVRKFAPSLQMAEQWVLYGGEDYHLVFTVKEQDVASLRKQLRRRCAVECYGVGEVIAAQKLFLQDAAGGDRVLPQRGYDAFWERGR